jgi:hypothetical protein
MSPLWRDWGSRNSQIKAISVAKGMRQIDAHRQVRMGGKDIGNSKKQLLDFGLDVTQLES